MARLPDAQARKDAENAKEGVRFRKVAAIMDARPTSLAPAVTFAGVEGRQEGAGLLSGARGVGRVGAGVDARVRGHDGGGSVLRG